MFKLKQAPEDFVVEEIPSRDFNAAGGKYSVFILRKKNYNSEDAVRAVAERLGVPRKSIGYAGTKDRNAVTAQYVSVLGSFRNDAEMKDISLQFAGTTNEPLSLGDLEGNRFRITLRNLDDGEKINGLTFFTNYFDSQRFSKNNAEVGRFIVRRKYADACALLKEDDSRDIHELKEHLGTRQNDFLGALKKVP